MRWIISMRLEKRKLDKIREDEMTDIKIKMRLQ